jgi:hypothetical protein
MLAFLRERVWPGVSKVRVNVLRAVLYRDPFRVRVPAHLGEHDEEWANMVRSGGAPPLGLGGSSVDCWRTHSRVGFGVGW